MRSVKVMPPHLMIYCHIQAVLDNYEKHLNNNFGQKRMEQINLSTACRASCSLLFMYA